MMSNCAFWSAAGELLAVHGASAGDPRESFGPWAAERRLPPGRLVPLSEGAGLTAALPGWQVTEAAPRPRKNRPPRPCNASSPVAAFAPTLDDSAARLLPPRVDHEKFTWKSWPTWVNTATLERDEGPEGWYAALEPSDKNNRYLLRLLPHRGRLPGEGWRNMLAWAVKSHAGLRLVPLNGLPRADVLAAAPAWQYRVEAGRGTDAAAWDVQVLPSRQLLLEWAPQAAAPWEATAVLRWLRPAPPPGEFGSEPKWADLLARLAPSDARLLVQNVLSTLPGGAAATAALLFDAHVLSSEGGPSLVRYVPQEGLPLALLSTLFGRRVWSEIERAKRQLPSEGELKVRRAEALADLDQRLAEGRLLWSASAVDLWDRFYREPVHRSLERELKSLRESSRWNDALTADHRVLEALLRGLDVTDAALCLRDAPDARWRRFVTRHREVELRREMDFCTLWDGRGELTVERQLEAWRAWDELVATFL